MENTVLRNSNAVMRPGLGWLDDAQTAALNNIAKLIGTKAGNSNNLNLLKISLYKICISLLTKTLLPWSKDIWEVLHQTNLKIDIGLLPL